MKRLLVAVISMVLATALSPVSPAFAATSITAGAQPNVIAQGAATAVTGQVSPANATSRVVVQRGIHGVWSDRNAGAVNSSGQFSIAVRPGQSGIYALRVRSNGGSVVSPTFYLRVRPSPIVGAYVQIRGLGGTIEEHHTIRLTDQGTYSVSIFVTNNGTVVSRFGEIGRFTVGTSRVRFTPTSAPLPPQRTFTGDASWDVGDYLGSPAIGLLFDNPQYAHYPSKADGDIYFRCPPAGGCV